LLTFPYPAADDLNVQLQHAQKLLNELLHYLQDKHVISSFLAKRQQTFQDQSFQFQSSCAKAKEDKAI
jgi:hypothetical protein